MKTPKQPKVYYKKMNDYAEAHLGKNKIYIDPKKFKGKAEGISTLFHERQHLIYPKMKEKDIIKLEKLHIKSVLSVI